jgi:hypothetical protein
MSRNICLFETETALPCKIEKRHWLSIPSALLVMPVSGKGPLSVRGKISPAWIKFAQTDGLKVTALSVFALRHFQKYVTQKLRDGNKAS